MSTPLITRVDCSWCSARLRLALAAVVLLLLLGEKVAAQSDGNGPAINTSSVARSDDADVPPLALEPFDPKHLTAADLPPSSPLIWRGFPHTSLVFRHDWQAGSNTYRALVERESRAFGLPPDLVDAVMAVESGYNPAAIGSDGEVGLMQVMLPTARMLGFTGTPAELADPETNIHYGAEYLAGAWRLAGEDLCTATMKYRAGHGETQFSFLSVDYCLRVRAQLAAHGVAVTGSVPRPTFGSSGGSRARPLSGGGSVNFAALNARLRALTDRKSPDDLR